MAEWLRPAIEDFIGAGAILSPFDPAELSPDAKMVAGAYKQVARHVSATVAECSSGRELVAKGLAQGQIDGVHHVV